MASNEKKHYKLFFGVVTKTGHVYRTSAYKYEYENRADLLKSIVADAEDIRESGTIVVFSDTKQCLLLGSDIEQVTWDKLPDDRILE